MKEGFVPPPRDYSKISLIGKKVYVSLKGGFIVGILKEYGPECIWISEVENIATQNDLSRFIGSEGIRFYLDSVLNVSLYVHKVYPEDFVIEE